MDQEILAAFNRLEDNVNKGFERLETKFDDCNRRHCEVEMAHERHLATHGAQLLDIRESVRETSRWWLGLLAAVIPLIFYAVWDILSKG